MIPDEHGRALKCEVCDKDDAVIVAASSCGPISFRYCESCLRSHAEPFGALVAYIGLAGGKPEEIRESYFPIIQSTCEKAGKTEDEFWQQAAKVWNEFIAEYNSAAEQPTRAQASWDNWNEEELKKELEPWPDK